MRNTKDLPNRPSLRGLVLALALTALSSYVATATPYASMVTNTSGTIQFYLNEGGGNVTITYNDGTTNASYDGITTGTNLAAGPYTFALGAHTSYSISVYKVGTGVPSLIASSVAFTPRGIAVNARPASPYFGRIYAANVTGPNGLHAFNPDFSLAVSNGTGGIAFNSGNTYDPYRISVAEDDYVMVGDGAYTFGGVGTLNDGVWRLAPTLTTSQLFLGPKGYTAGLAAGVHTTIGSRPIVLGNVQAGGPVTLLDVDADAGSWAANSLLVYKNITLAALPWQNPPDVVGPPIGLNLASRTLGGNSYPGLQANGNYIYSGTYRANYSNPLLQIYTNDIGNGDTLSLVWDSRTAAGGVAGTGPDLFYRANGGFNNPTIDIGVSPDDRYVAGLSLYNYVIIMPLTNGLPDSANLFMNTPTSYTGNGRAIAWDAADNFYVSSSGLGLVQSWSLGITTTATTTGNASGATGFSVIFPSTTVNMATTTAAASQGGANGVVGTPVPGVFTITRSNPSSDYSTPITVNFTLAGTAPAAAYTVSPTNGITPAVGGSVFLPAGVISTNISIIPTTNNVPRPTQTVVLAVKGGATYGVTQPASGTVVIQNTSSNQLVVTAGAPTMYKAHSNDFASITITRWGDTNAPSYTVPASAFTYSGAAVPNTDFTPLPDVTFNPGDLVVVPRVSPLSNGVPPVHTINPVYAGNKSVTVALPAGPQYIISGANSTALTLIDNADLPNAVLFADPLTDPSDASHWNITFGTGNQVPPYDSDYTVDFGYDLTANNPNVGANGLIGLPPSGATNALRITCVKTAGQSYGGGVNLYYTNQAFSGNYAVRFNLNLVEGNQSLYAVEGVSFGINHNGIETNWWLGGGAVTSGGPWASDGVWYWIQSPPGGYGGFGFTEFEEFTGAGGKLPNTGWTQLATAARLPNVFKPAVFTAPGSSTGGTPANNSPVSATPADNSWSDVEIKQVNNVVTLNIDKTQIFSYANTTTFTNGYLMLGYNCPLQGIANQFVGTPDASAYFSNLRVVSLARPAITGITDTKSGNNNNVAINFLSNDGDDTAASFALQSSGTNSVSKVGAFADVGAATITQILSTNTTAAFFQASVTVTNTAQFYRIRHK